MEFKNQKPKPKSSWLDEEGEWSELKQRVRRQAARDAARNQYDASKGIKPAPPKPVTPEKVEVNIKLSLPRYDYKRVTRHFNPAVSALKSVPSKLKQTTIKRRAIASGGLCAVLIGVVALNVLTNPDAPTQVQGAATEQANQNADIIPSAKPLFEVVTPQNHEIKKELIAFDSKRNFAKFDDEINGVKVTVTQQPLPDTFKADPQKSTEDTAKNFSASEKLESQGQAMYYGRSEKGPETIIFTKKDLLVFVNTTSMVGKENIKLYAADLN